MTNQEDDIADNIIAVSVMLDALERDNNREAVRKTLAAVGAVLAAHWEPPLRTSKKPLRGIGYSKEEALIVKSIPDHGSLPAAIRAYFPQSNPEWHEAVEKRIRRHTREIEAAGLHDPIGLALSGDI
jgi:hypothetical protein